MKRFGNMLHPLGFGDVADNLAGGGADSGLFYHVTTPFDSCSRHGRNCRVWHIIYILEGGQHWLVVPVRWLDLHVP